MTGLHIWQIGDDDNDWSNAYDDEEDFDDDDAGDDNFDPDELLDAETALFDEDVLELLEEEDDEDYEEW